MIRRFAAAAALLATGVAIAGCTPTVHLDPAADANSTDCAAVSVRLPESLGDTQRVWTDAQATAAWGDGPDVIFTCGVEVPGPTTLQCVTFGGVDWIVDPEDTPDLRITTYGRTPAAQVYVDTTKVTADAVLDALASAASELPKTGECISAESATPVPDAPETGDDAG
ncbi:DUF3515 family protein [Microbacterium indicum]|uniref:DUF3515 family protein n=1 Tax=Microbacterium indicum TaxID=358100 RepID=UPI0004287585|nr:DUF3515 family protein [Microbacterium indicum]